MLCVSVLLILLAALAAVFDLRTSKIPNTLLLWGMLLIFPARLLFDVPEVLLPALSGSVLVMLCLFPFFCAGALGAGDIKLLAVLGLGLTPDGLLNLLFASFLIGAAGGLLLMAVNRGERQSRLHFAPAICLGLLPAICLNSQPLIRLPDF